MTRPTSDWLQCCWVTRNTLRYGPTRAAHVGRKEIDRIERERREALAFGSPRVTATAKASRSPA